MSKHTVIIDQIGRTILGVNKSESWNTTDDELTLYNPIILHFQPSQNGQLELQVFPLFFFELLDKSARDKNSWTWKKSNIAISDVELTPEILSRYEQINTPPVAQVQTNPRVIAIDDV